MPYRGQAPGALRRMDLPAGLRYRLDLPLPYMDAQGRIRFYSEPQPGMTRVYYGLGATGGIRPYSVQPPAPRAPLLDAQGDILF